MTEDEKAQAVIDGLRREFEIMCGKCSLVFTLKDMPLSPQLGDAIHCAVCRRRWMFKFHPSFGFPIWTDAD